MNENLNETELSTASTRTTRRQSVNVMPGQRLVASNESYEALAEGLSADRIVHRIMQTVPQPARPLQTHVDLAPQS
jgi:hypothetical protein